MDISNPWDLAEAAIILVMALCLLARIIRGER
jgi:hypothetical protein